MSTFSSFRHVLNIFDHTEGSFETIKLLFRILPAINVVIIPSASILLSIRVRAVYSRNIYINIFFGSCWLVVFGFFAFDSINGLLRCSRFILPTQCFVLHHTDAWGYMANVVYDTLLYLSISWRLASFAPTDRWQDRLKSFFTGEGLGWLSRVLLQSGQLYYL